jgi:hypothetical protein
VIDSADVAEPDVRSALAYHFITDESIQAKEILRTGKQLEPGTIIVWRKGNTIYGHTGFLIRWKGSSGITIEANTSPGDYGRQRDGDGVYVRKRSIQPLNYFRITHFTKVSYDA